jgi:putative restriction endonuclease
MNLYVALTDEEQVRCLRRQPALDEANFWQPAGNRRFRALAPGEPFLFKLHRPHDAIVGGGFFATASLLPVSAVWDAFGGKNGAESLPAMRGRIERYRPGPPDPRADYTVGCIVLQQPFFFDEADWIKAPADFSPAIVQGKRYDLARGAGQALWQAVRQRLRTSLPGDEAEPQMAMFGEPTLIRPRLGLGTFRVLVLDAYRRRCAASGERTLPLLDVVHVKPPEEGGQNVLGNGLLLRADLARLFARGYLAVDAEGRLVVSRRLADDWGGGEPYLPLAGRELYLPADERARPRPELLAWHRATVFRG